MVLEMVPVDLAVVLEELVPGLALVDATGAGDRGYWR